MTSMLTASIKPVYGVNYKTGYIGFVFNDNSFVSQGIVWFTRWDRNDIPPVSHSLIVTGENACVEANIPGVQRADLNQYFDSPHSHIFFREPLGYSEELVLIVTEEALSHVGHNYDFALIASNAFANTVIGHFINRWTNNWPNRIISWLLNSKLAEICSELVAMCLRKVPWLINRGCLKLPPRMITPQRLAGDDEIFKAMK